MGVLDGKRALIMGVANKRSIAWGIASAMRREGAQLAFTHPGDQRLLDNLNELVAIRNQLAHGGTGVTVRKSEVTRFRTYVVGFARGVLNRVRPLRSAFDVRVGCGFAHVVHRQRETAFHRVERN